MAVGVNERRHSSDSLNCTININESVNFFKEFKRSAGRERRGVYRGSVGKPEGKRPLGKPRRRWEDNITMDLQEVGCGSMDWIELAKDRDRCRAFVNAIMNLRVP